MLAAGAAAVAIGRWQQHGITKRQSRRFFWFVNGMAKMVHRKIGRLQDRPRQDLAAKSRPQTPTDADDRCASDALARGSSDI